jgi:hypothetical protein
MGLDVCAMALVIWRVAVLLVARPRSRSRCWDALRGELAGMEIQVGRVVVHYVEHGTGRPVLVLQGAGVDHRETPATRVIITCYLRPAGATFGGDGGRRAVYGQGRPARKLIEAIRRSTAGRGWSIRRWRPPA